MCPLRIENSATCVPAAHVENRATKLLAVRLVRTGLPVQPLSVAQRLKLFCAPVHWRLWLYDTVLSCRPWISVTLIGRRGEGSPVNRYSDEHAAAAKMSLASAASRCDIAQPFEIPVT